MIDNGVKFPFWEKNPKRRGGVHHIHMIGISGSGMSAIAEILISLGYHVTGSDLRSQSREINLLRDLGAEIYSPHGWHFVKNPDLLIYSSAIPASNIEIIKAKELSVPIVSRGQMLASLLLEKKSIALTGSHGKTTTSAMLSWVLTKGGMDPSCILGGQAMEDGKSARVGAGDWLVAEGDESDGSFSLMQPHVAIINNLDADHLDFYGSVEAIYQRFHAFINNIPALSFGFVNQEHKALLEQCGEINRRLFTFGKKDPAYPQSDYVFSDLKYHQHSSFTLEAKDGFSIPVHSSLPGEHNAMNATVALATAREIGVDESILSEALIDFPGVKRRFERVKEGAIPIITDYGHHPKELEYTFNTVKRLWPDRELVVIFEPHRYSRTQALYREFAQVLQTVDHAVLTPIYEANEAPIEGVSTHMILKELSQLKQAPAAVYGKDVKDVQFHLENLKLNKAPVFVFQGAGIINFWAAQLCDHLVKKYQPRWGQTEATTSTKGIITMPASSGQRS